MRKLTADYIFPITHEPVRHGVLTIDDDGTILDLSQGDDSRDVAEIEFYEGIIVPGFVNAHCHLELSHMKDALPQGVGMGNFCKGVMSLRNNHSIDEQIEIMSHYDKQMYSEGIVAVGDISNGESSFSVKQHSSIYYHTFIECLGYGDDKAYAIIKNALGIQDNAHKMGLQASIALHAPYSMSERLFAETIRLGIDNGIISIHNQESAEEMELFATGNSNLRSVFEKFGFDPSILSCKNPIDKLLKYLAPVNLLLIHNVYSSAGDVERVSSINPRTTWVLCPNSNLYIENSLPPATMFYYKNVNVAIGTDSLSSNTNLSILDELKTLNTRFPQIPLHTLLYWATLGGAKALMKDAELGSFNIGKRPGITLINNINYDSMILKPDSRQTNLLQQ